MSACFCILDVISQTPGAYLLHHNHRSVVQDNHKDIVRKISRSLLILHRSPDRTVDLYVKMKRHHYSLYLYLTQVMRYICWISIQL